MFIQLRSRAEILTQTERVWTPSLQRRNAVSQKSGRDTHPERSAGVLDEECRKERQTDISNVLLKPPVRETGALSHGC